MESRVPESGPGAPGGLHLEVFEQVLAGQHVLVENAADEDALLTYKVEDDMLLVLDAPIAFADTIAGPANARLRYQ